MLRHQKLENLMREPAVCNFDPNSKITKEREIVLQLFLPLIDNTTDTIRLFGALEKLGHNRMKAGQNENSKKNTFIRHHKTNTESGNSIRRLQRYFFIEN